jgi:hypothetical protein
MLLGAKWNRSLNAGALFSITPAWHSSACRRYGTLCGSVRGTRLRPHRWHPRSHFGVHSGGHFGRRRLRKCRKQGGKLAGFGIRVSVQRISLVAALHKTNLACCFRFSLGYVRLCLSGFWCMLLWFSKRCCQGAGQGLACHLDTHRRVS